VRTGLLRLWEGMRTWKVWQKLYTFIFIFLINYYFQWYPEGTLWVSQGKVKWHGAFWNIECRISTALLKLHVTSRLSGLRNSFQSS
jgi:hypothetical protein